MNPLNKIVSQLDEDGCYCCPTIAEESPLEPGVFLIPGGAVDMTPPNLEPGKAYKLNSEGSGWVAVADHRAVAVYLTSDGSAYVLGHERGDGNVYAGLGSIPDWLTTEPRPDAWSVWKSGTWLRDDAAWLAHVSASNQAKKEQLSSAVTARIATLQDAVELGISSPEEATMLQQLRVYRVELSRVDVTHEEPTWPIAPDSDEAGAITAD